MRRDAAELIRVLKTMESEEVPTDWDASKDPAGAYHAWLLITAQRASGRIGDDGSVFQCRLTWAGHDYLDNIEAQLRAQAGGQ